MAKPYEQLEIRDDFMYGKVTQDLELTRRLLEIVTGRRIEEVRFAENEKTIIATIEGKDVRLDSYVEDDRGVVYNSEMQNRGKEDRTADPQLPKRSRYYQGMIDINILNGGARYQELKQSYVIFICTFDPFGKNLKRYTFENVCIEDPEIRLNDKTTKIFFNTKGTRKQEDEITAPQDALLHYVETGEATDEFTELLDRRVQDIRQDKKWRREYMKELIVMQECEDRGLERGIEKSRKENCITMLRDKMDITLIARYTGLSIEVIEEYKKEISAGW